MHVDSARCVWLGLLTGLSVGDVGTLSLIVPVAWTGAVQQCREQVAVLVVTVVRHVCNTRRHVAVLHSVTSYNTDTPYCCDIHVPCYTVPQCYILYTALCRQCSPSVVSPATFVTLVVTS